MRSLQRLVGWVAAFVLVTSRLTCRYRIPTYDPRPALRAEGKGYIYALLHAHQVAAVFCNDERALCAMVSRSADGDLLAPSLRLRRVSPVRGSSRKGDRDKGGRRALAGLAEFLAQGVPVLLAVDGPRGPRNNVHRGVADLAMEMGAVVLPTVVVSSRKWILRKSWDRFQIPKPFARIDLCFGPSVTAKGHSVDSLRAAVSDALVQLEQRHDPDEAALACPLGVDQGSTASDG